MGTLIKLIVSLIPFITGLIFQGASPRETIRRNPIHTFIVGLLIFVSMIAFLLGSALKDEKTHVRALKEKLAGNVSSVQAPSSNACAPFDRNRIRQQLEEHR